jgi:PAS domain S-box-containing protein
VRLPIRRSSLQVKIIAWAFVPTAIILAAVALTGFYAYQRVTESLVYERNQELVRRTAGQLTTELGEYSSTLAAVARVVGASAADPVAQRAALGQMANRLAIFDGGVVALDNHGTVTAAMPDRPSIYGQDWSDRGYFQQLVMTMNPAFSNITEDGPGGGQVIAVAAPIVNAGGSMSGVLVGMFRLGATSVSSFYGTIVKMRIGGSTDASLGAYLVDRYGLVIYHSDPAHIGADFRAQPAVRQVLAGQAGALRARDVNGLDTVAAYAPVLGTPWGLVTEIGWQSLVNPSREYSQFLLLLLLLGVLVPAGVVAVGVRRITHPIAELIVGAQKVADGDFGYTIEASTRDEIEDLVKQFNIMSTKLLDSYTTLREREERLSLAMRGTHDGYWDWNLVTNAVFFSPRWKNMLGYEEHEIANQFEAWVSLMHPEDKDATLRTVQEYLEGKTTVYQAEHRLRHRDGSYRWILARGVALRDEQGQPYRMAGSHTDTTERKKADDELRASEAQLSALFASIPDAIFVINAAGRYLQVAPNAHTHALLSQPPDQLVGRTFHDVFAPAQADLFLDYVRRALETRQTVSAEYGLETDAGPLWFAASISPMQQDTVVWVARDITARKNAERDLEERLDSERLVSSISSQFINLAPDEMDAGIENALQALGAFSGVDRTVMMLFGADGKSIGAVAEWCAEGVAPHAYPMQGRPVGDFPWTTARLTALGVINIPRLEALPAEAEADRGAYHALGVRSVLMVPLVYRGEASGLVSMEMVREEREWSEHDIVLLRLVGEVIANALEHKREQNIQSGQRRLLELLATGGSFAETLHALVRMIEEQSPGMQGLVLLLDQDGRRLHYGAAASLPEEYTHSIEGLEIGPQVGSCGTACFTGERVIVEDTATDPRWEGLRELALKYGLRACWSEPVFFRGHVAGTFAMYYQQPRAPSRAELHTIETAAHLVEVAVEQKRAREALDEAYQTLERRVEERTHELAVLHAITAVVNRSLDVHEVMDIALEKMLEAMDMDVGVAYEIVESNETAEPVPMMRMIAERGFTPGVMRPVSIVPLRGSMAERSARMERPLIWRVDDYPNELVREVLLGEGLQQVVSVPLVVKGQMLGGIALVTRTPRLFTPEDLALLGAIGQQVAVAVENARLFQQAEQTAAMEERTRLARELHDSVTQSLYSVNLYAEAAARLLITGETKTAAEYLRELRDTAQEALREMRLLIFELRPLALEQHGLVAALQARLDAVEGRAGIQNELRVEGEERVPQMIQEQLYHLAREALNNVLKHAKAQHVRVTLRFSAAEVTLEVKDDGAGFDLAQAKGGGMGLPGMSERVEKLGGTLAINSAPGQGTVVAVSLPLDPLGAAL